ncbi:hypothetical protein ACFQ21_04130 [Ohtaekwangia kribbensis]|uniref:Uncharacterized protein n=1 Tax=Ohtaekwangia kribbensis TaxID=688913 RepID=A0ABW3JZX1_9BACT
MNYSFKGMKVTVKKLSWACVRERDLNKKHESNQPEIKRYVNILFSCPHHPAG